MHHVQAGALQDDAIMSHVCVIAISRLCATAALPAGMHVVEQHAQRLADEAEGDPEAEVPLGEVEREVPLGEEHCKRKLLQSSLN